MENLSAAMLPGSQKQYQFQFREAVYVKSANFQVPDLYQSLTKTVLPLVGRPVTVHEVAVPREPLL